MADSGSIWVAVNVKAAIGSNLYADEISQNGAWIGQSKATVKGKAGAPLGDRWQGEATISKNSIKIVMTRSGPADESGQRRTMTIEATRP